MTETLISPVAIRLTTATASPGLSNREIGRLPLRCLPLGPRQGCANQTAMNRTVVITLFVGSERQRL
jgi:hypothetical protein